jgi:phosphoglycerol transferase MdoB-like AlkP superfamily enzyme
MTKNISDVGKFASLKITYPLIINFILLIAYIYISYKLNITHKLSFKKRFIRSCLVTIFVIILLTTSISSKVFTAFEIRTNVATNVLESNEQFSDIGFLPFLTQTASQEATNDLKAPENYNKETINKLISKSTIDKPTKANKPNIVFIMSESFGDFRTLGADISNDVYKSFDEIASEGYLGNCIVPTFGGYTTRTEFELLVGLPVYSLNTPSIPQNMLKNQKVINTIPLYFKNLGYETTYIHPFSGSFYNRETLYKNYGFDNLYFENTIEESSERFKRYISDKSVFELIKNELINNENPSYIFTTTMQNHQPYYVETDEGQDQLSYYLEGIKKTSDDLREFTNWLKEYDEDVLLVFVGDHFPFFTPDDNIYERIGITEKNADVLYRQKYILWNNYDATLIDKDINEISTFYIPYVVSDLLGVQSTAWIKTMKDIMIKSPIYSPNIQSNNTRDEALDILTYDRVLGEGWSNYSN